MEKREQLAPVAARILAYIILTGKKGSTFEDMVSILCASKSTMVINHIENMIEEWKEVKELHLEIKNYKQIINDEKIEKEEEKFDLNFHNDYIKFIDSASASIEELRLKLTDNQFDI